MLAELTGEGVNLNIFVFRRINLLLAQHPLDLPILIRPREQERKHRTIMSASHVLTYYPRTAYHQLRTSRKLTNNFAGA
jgi:hypothetical protein